ncbi:TPA: IdeS/Mac family cysteine endopeptidase [Streptococcus suis]
MHNPVRFALRKLSVGLVSVAFLFVMATTCSVGVSADTETTLGSSTNEISTLSDIGDSEGLALAEERSSQAESVTNPSQLDQPQSDENQTEVSTPRLNGESSATNQEASLPSRESRSGGEPAYAGENLVVPVSQPTSHYVTESGETREIIWAQGVTPPSMGEAGDFEKEVTGEFVEYSMPFEAGKGYYDANKSLDASIEDLNLCFAAVSSNMLHWWLEQNKDYVERFISEKYGADLGQQDYSLTDVRRYTDSFEDQQNSQIFNLFKAYYGRRLNGFVSDALVDLFINGYPPKHQGGVNLENPDLVPDKRGGFFHAVFKEKLLTDRMFSGDYHYFGNLVRNTLENQGLLGLAYRTFGTTTHIVTVWGAEYDEQGLIRAVYITDSDDQHQPIGLKRMGITRDSSGNPRLNNNVVKNSVGSHLDYVHTIKLGQTYWEEYFNPIEEARQLARQQLATEKEAVLLAIMSQEEFSEKEKNAFRTLLEARYDEALAAVNEVVASAELTTVLESGMKQLAIPMQKLGEAVQYSLSQGHLSVHGTSLTHELPAGHLSVHGSSLTHELPAGHLSVHGSSVTHELPVGHLSLHGSSVTHELPAGHLSVHGPSVTYELPAGHLSVHGSSVTHELPSGHLSVHGSSVTHELPSGHLSVHCSSVTHELPVGHLSVHGSSVTHELPEGHLSVHGTSVMHELPAGHLILRGSSVTHELPKGHLSVSGTSLTHELPTGHLSVHGSSVTHELPAGHLSVHGSSVTHELPAGHLSVHGSSLTHEFPAGKPPIRFEEEVDGGPAVRGGFSRESEASNQFVGKMTSSSRLNKSDGANLQSNSSSCAAMLLDSFNRDWEQNQVNYLPRTRAIPQEQDRMEKKVIARGPVLDSREKDMADLTLYLVVFSILGIGFVCYKLFIHKCTLEDN